MVLGAAAKNGSKLFSRYDLANSTMKKDRFSFSAAVLMSIIGVGVSLFSTNQLLLASSSTRSILKMKKNTTNSKPFERKSHNQKIRDAHIQRKQEKELDKKVKEEHKQAVNTAMAQYKINKQNRSKKLVKKTRRGQPIMGEQIELLLNKIQQQKEKK
ncbi:hypothetical protein I4U23_011908 [Adineta vaga]|nr:hypothetical protein I4U23_011908 [Adineta vaga]